MDAQATLYSVLQHGTPNSPESFLTGCTAYPTGINDPACVNADRADPLNYATPDDPPFLLFHGSKDQLLPPGQTQVLFNDLADRCVDAEFHLVHGPNHTYSYLQHPGAPPVTDQTVQTVDRTSCHVETTEGLAPGTVPGYALIASFLDRTIGRPEAGGETFEARVEPVAIDGRSARLAVRTHGGDADLPLEVTVRSSRPRVLEADRVDITGVDGDRTLVIEPRRRDSGRTTLTVTVTRGSDSVTLRVALLVGTRRADELRGTTGVDVIIGRGGHDLAAGRGGDDALSGGGGRDKVRGGPGADLFAGPRGHDTWPDFDSSEGDVVTR